MITVGLNAGFGAPLAAEFAGLATYGFAVARQDVWVSEDLPIATALVTEFAGAPVRPLYLIGGGHMQHANGTVLMPSELAMWTIETIEAAHTAGITNYALEIGNEPDIAHQVYADDPHVFAVAVRLCYDMARAHGFTGSVITGGIANLDERGMAYLATCVPTFPRGVVVGFHRYPPAGGNAETPHAPYRSREDEWQHLMGVVDGRRVACTEFGYHTSEEHRHQRTDQDVAEAVLWDLEFFEAHGVRLACVYQLNDGPSEEWLDRFGVRTVDGFWKPVAEAIRATYGPGSG